MIVPMKKIFLIVQKKDVVSAIEVLRKMGTVHVEHQSAPQGYRIEEIKEEMQELKRVAGFLAQEKTVLEQERPEDPQRTLKNILELLSRTADFKEQISKYQAQINFWEPWGHFDIHQIEHLVQAGLQVKLYEVPEKEIGKIEGAVVLEKVFSEGGMARCVAVAQKKIDLPFHAVPLPKMSLNELISLKEKAKRDLRGTEDRIKDSAKYLQGFQQMIRELENELKFQESISGVGAHEELAYLKGFCPSDNSQQIAERAQKESWGIIVEETTDDDNVPTLIRNPRWVALIKPVFDFTNILPGYKEFDISIFFLIFFALFVGMLIGDAGYGMLFVLLTAFVQFKNKEKIKNKTPLYLVYLLSGCTVAWGMLTGTYFGQQWIPQGTVGPLVPWLADSDHIQMFCFLLGAIQISIAHSWRAVLKIPSIAALAEVGWLCLVWGMFFTAKMLILAEALPGFAKWFFIAGPFLVIFFTKPNKNIFKAMGAGVGDFLLNVINTFTDVVSYIRLFAVGLATVAVADATNAFAQEIGFGNIGAVIGASLILFAGHLINIVLAVMAILVHGLRLNVLEFSSHLNMEWTGFKYDPLKEIKEAT